ncbi:MAG TPA: type II secretion system F family protein [Mycobacteriales bacterium]|jgi:pilus assembly protein TadC
MPSLTETVSACCLLAAGAALLRPAPVARRLRALTRSRRPTAVRATHRRVPVRVVAVLAGVSVWAVVGGIAGAVVGVVVSAALDHALRRLEPAEVRRDREAAAVILPFAADLLAAALTAGATVDGALRSVGTAIGGPLGERLHRVAAAHALGAGPEDIWRPLVDLPGALPVIRAAQRSDQSGSALALVLRRAADSARAAEEASHDAAARRAGVLVVLPVGLCFLPAFVLIGVVPVIVGVLADVLRW